jgi:hypothetical protein
MTRYRPYIGRGRTRKDTIARILLIVLFLSLVIPPALAGKLQDKPQMDKQHEDTIMTDTIVTDTVGADYNGNAGAELRTLPSLSASGSSVTGADMQRAYELLYIAPAPAADPMPEPSPSPAAPIYDIALSDELQIYTYDLCQEYDVDYETVLAVMYIESRYQPEVVSRTHDYGLMQINKYNHKWLSEALGFTYTTTDELRQNFLDPYNNILAGVYMLSESAGKYSDVHRMLMVYNLGPGGAKNLWNQGIYSTQYSRAVVAQADVIRGLGHAEG